LVQNTAVVLCSDTWAVHVNTMHVLRRLPWVMCLYSENPTFLHNLDWNWVLLFKLQYIYPLRVLMP
jgi:hypothetical protein